MDPPMSPCRGVFLAHRLCILHSFLHSCIKHCLQIWSISISGLRDCPLERFHLLQHGNAKRDSIYCKTRQWNFYWLQNATRYANSCFMYYRLQNAIIDSKTRFFVWHMSLTTRVPACTWQWIIAEASSLLNPLTHSSPSPPARDTLILEFSIVKLRLHR